MPRSQPRRGSVSSFPVDTSRLILLYTILDMHPIFQYRLQTTIDSKSALLLSVLALGLAACSGISGSAVRQSNAAAYKGEVRVIALDPPAGAIQVGIIQAKGPWTIDALTKELKAQCASVGGDLAKVDEVGTKYEMITENQTYSYNCGTAQSPRTCTGTRTVTKEVGTTQIVGRAFRTEK